MACCKSKPKFNEIYNGDFKIGQDGCFPDGWQRNGGSSTTKWRYKRTQDNERFVAIHYPSGPATGIVQMQQAAVHCGEEQKWVARVVLSADLPGCSAYVKVHFINAPGYFLGTLKFDVCTSREPEVYEFAFTTEAMTNSFILEIGICGCGDLIIFDVEACRLHPACPVKLDPEGKLFIAEVDTVGEILKPIELAGPISVSVDSNIRSLTPFAPYNDAIKIYGSSHVPVSTTAAGVVLVEMQPGFFQVSQNINAGTVPITSNALDVSTYRVYTYAVINSGPSAVQVQIEVSPDNTNWAVDSPQFTVNSGGVGTFTPNSFLRYIRLSLVTTAGTANITVWLQAQF